MKPVCFRKFPKLSISRTLILFLLVTILVSCGENNITTSSQAGSKSSNTINKSTSSSNTVFNTDTSPRNASNITENIGNLRIQSNDGFQCPYFFYAGGGFIVDQLVLASGRTTYSQSEIKQIIAYMPTLRSIILRSPMPGVKPPPTLRWVSVGSIDHIPGTFGIIQSSPCGTALNLINTGNTPIQVPKVSVQLEARPHPNSYQYRLIDACSIVPKSQGDSTGYCGPAIGGGGDCNTYFASIQLGPGEKNDVFSGAPNVIGCNTLTIAPASQVQLVFRFSLTTNTPKNLIYSILPRLTVDTAQGEQTFSLPQLASTLTFASANQFSCYQLHGTTFFLIHPPINLPPQFCV
jgi:hypothetical protein